MQRHSLVADAHAGRTPDDTLLKDSATGFLDIRPFQRISGLDAAAAAAPGFSQLPTYDGRSYAHAALLFSQEALSANATRAGYWAVDAPALLQELWRWALLHAMIITARAKIAYIYQFAVYGRLRATLACFYLVCFFSSRHHFWPMSARHGRIPRRFRYYLNFMHTMPPASGASTNTADQAAAAMPELRGGELFSIQQLDVAADDEHRRLHAQCL